MFAVKSIQISKIHDIIIYKSGNLVLFFIWISLFEIRCYLDIL